MRVVGKSILYLVLALLGCALVIAAILYVMGMLSVPDDQEETALPGLSGPVQVLFDPKGIPTIRAASMRDAYRSLGYLHARERLWQMETTRRIGAGRMAEIVGTPMLSYDVLMRELGLLNQATAQESLLEPEELADLKAYTEGVNAYLADRPRPLPIEFQITRHEPEPWTVRDSLLWGRLMSIQLSGDAFREAQTAAITALLGAERASELMPRNEKTPTTMNDGNRNAWIADYDASNAWVLSGARTDSGKPILANDPHLGLRMPGQWYLARIETPELTLTGATAPGVPMHVLGHNGTIAWGMTTTHSDNQDTVILDRTAISNATIRDEVIHVRFRDPVPLSVMETEYGPVVSRLGTPPRALLWTGTSERQRTASALYALNRAQNWDDFLRALDKFDDPAQNVFYADIHGDIGMKVVGTLPIRAPGHGGSLPITPDDEAWHGSVLPESMPGLHNPDDGMILNANNRIITDAFPYQISERFEPGYRIERLRERLAETPKHHRLEDSMSIQTDILSDAARRLVPRFLRAEPNTKLAADALTLMAAWDYQMDRRKAAPAIYMTMLNELVRVLAEDDLGADAFEDYWSANAEFVEAVFTQNTSWCDDIRTKTMETCAWALATALDRAVFILNQNQGDTAEDWHWGKPHTASMQHQLLDLVPGFSILGNRPLETSGGDHTLNRGQSRGGAGKSPFTHIHGAGFRAIYDLADLDNSLYALAGGQSGNPFSPHYADLLKDWRDGRYFRIPGRDEDSPEDGGALLILRP